jgi:hypothetical protein
VKRILDEAPVPPLNQRLRSREQRLRFDVSDDRLAIKPKNVLVCGREDARRTERVDYALPYDPSLVA